MGPPGIPGPPGEVTPTALPRFVERIETRRDGQQVLLVQIFSDGTEGLITPLGFTFQKYKADGTLEDSVEVPNGGHLKFQYQIRGQ